MSAGCTECARRSSLLVHLGIPLDFRARDVERLWDVLKLPDEQLIAALGGSRREQLRAWHASLPDPPEGLPGGVERICRHLEAYPKALRESPLAPHELHVLGGVDRLREILSEPVVAIVGIRRCTDYGMEIARELGRELAAAGVSVIGELADGISYGAHAGVLQAQGSSVAVMGGGVDKCSPECCGPVYRRLVAAGCVVSELPCGAEARRWAQLARARTLALLAELVIVVEAGEHPRELACVQLARTLGKKLGAVPGRITSQPSRGTNQLIKERVELVRGAQDALDLLYGVGQRTAASPARQLEPRLQAILRRIGEGRDTIAKLSAPRGSSGALLEALAELELRGLVMRGDGGRYVPRASALSG
jgi:DNA processing protein